MYIFTEDEAAAGTRCSSFSVMLVLGADEAWECQLEAEIFLAELRTIAACAKNY